MKDKPSPSVHKKLIKIAKFSRHVMIIKASKNKFEVINYILVNERHMLLTKFVNVQPRK